MGVTGTVCGDDGHGGLWWGRGDNMLGPYPYYRGRGKRDAVEVEGGADSS